MEIFQDIKIPATIVHVLSVVLGMGGALVSDFLFSFFSKDKSLNKTEIATLSVLSTVVLYGLGLIILSGITIFLSDVTRYMNSDKFLAKMTILLILCINGYLLNKYVWPHLLNKKFFVARSERNIRRIAFVCGAVSVISWLSVCALGVVDSLPIPYIYIMGIYLGIIFFGSMVALLVERKEFN
jgi:hypothetical protein